MINIEISTKDAFRLGRRFIKGVGTVWLGSQMIIGYMYKKENKELKKKVDDLNKRVETLESK